MDLLEETQARTVMRKMKTHFARSIIPGTLFSGHTIVQENSSDSVPNRNLNTRHLPLGTHKVTRRQGMAYTGFP